MNLGLLDLPAPLWDAIDRGLDAVGIPALARVILYGIASAWVSMAIYRRASRQEELQSLAAESRALRAELAGYDGEFDGLMQRVRRLMRLSVRHLGLSFLPALLAGLPLLFVLPWLSNAYSHSFPSVGTSVPFVPTAIETPAASLRWSGIDAPYDAELGGWRIDWPAESSPIQLIDGSEPLLSLPLSAPVSVVHRRDPLLNLLVANPAGYLPDDAPIEAVLVGLPERALLPWGPSWLRGWLASYVLAVVAGSLWLRWRWRLQ